MHASFGTVLLLYACSLHVVHASVTLLEVVQSLQRCEIPQHQSLCLFSLYRVALLVSTLSNSAPLAVQAFLL